MPGETPTGPPSAPRARRSARARPAESRPAGGAASEPAASEPDVGAPESAASELTGSDFTASERPVPELPISDAVPEPAYEFHHRDTMPTRHRLPGAAPGPGPNLPSAQGDRDDWHGHDWLDEEAGPVVRPYTMTGGRSRPVTSGLSLLTYVEALYTPEADLIHLQPEHRAILAMTRTALSIAEVAGRLDLPVGVVKVLVGDLLQANLVSTFDSDATVNPPDESILQAVIDGLRAL